MYCIANVIYMSQKRLMQAAGVFRFLVPFMLELVPKFGKLSWLRANRHFQGKYVVVVGK